MFTPFLQNLWKSWGSVLFIVLQQLLIFWALSLGFDEWTHHISPMNRRHPFEYDFFLFLFGGICYCLEAIFEPRLFIKGFCRPAIFQGRCFPILERFIQDKFGCRLSFYVHICTFMYICLCIFVVLFPKKKSPKHRIHRRLVNNKTSPSKAHSPSLWRVKICVIDTGGMLFGVATPPKTNATWPWKMVGSNFGISEFPG